MAKATIPVAVDEQDRARQAHAAILAAAADRESWRAYRAIVLKLPVLVHREGLAVALHFVAARSKPAQRKVLAHLARDLGMADTQALLRWIRSLRDAQLRDATVEVQRRLAWYKRIAQGFGRDGDVPPEPETGTGQA